MCIRDRCRLLGFHVQVEGEEPPLGYLARAVVGGAVVPTHELVEPRGVNILACFQSSDYF